MNEFYLKTKESTTFNISKQLYWYLRFICDTTGGVVAASPTVVPIPTQLLGPGQQMFNEWKSGSDLICSPDFGSRCFLLLNINYIILSPYFDMSVLWFLESQTCIELVHRTMLTWTLLRLVVLISNQTKGSTVAAGDLGFWVESFDLFGCTKLGNKKCWKVVVSIYNLYWVLVSPGVFLLIRFCTVVSSIFQQFDAADLS